MTSIADWIDKLVIENIKIFNIREKLTALDANNPLQAREYTELYQKMMVMVENRAKISNCLDDKIEKVATGKEHNEFLVKIRTYNNEKV